MTSLTYTHAHTRTHALPHTPHTYQSQFDGPCAVAVDVDGRIAVVDYNDYLTTIYIIEPDNKGRDSNSQVAESSTTHAYATGSKGNATIRKLELVDTTGKKELLASPFRGWTNIAIGPTGEIYCANGLGVHCITNTGLSAGLTPWWTPSFWTPTAGVWRRMSKSARAATFAVLLVLSRTRQLRGQG